MKIIIDTRERKPLVLTEVQTVVKKLDFGDYACILEDGYIIPVVFERKSVTDLFGTLSNGYDRFKHEIMRCQDQRAKMVLIIEGSLSKVAKGIKHSQRDPASLLAQVFTLFVKYGIFPVFCKNPEEASQFIVLFYKAFEKNYIINKQR